MKAGQRVSWYANHTYGNSGVVVDLAKENVGSKFSTPPKGHVWVMWDAVFRVSLAPTKHLKSITDQAVV